MRSSDRVSILKRVLSLPTAPFAEREVIAFVRRFCDARGLGVVRSDPAGNLMLRVHRLGARVARPICLTAHMDHPGFVVTGSAGRTRVRAVWRGGVRPDYFPGARVRFWSDGAWTSGVIQSVTHAGRGANRRVTGVVASVSGSVSAGAIGMWDLPDPVVRGKCIYARACDDLAGLAAVLCCAAELAGGRTAVDARFLFTRAEEVGFVGALAACRNRTIANKCVVVAVENSSEIPGVRMGDGPILRVGDKATVFTPAVTAHCATVAEQLARRDRRFAWQRKLMDGGTCESTAFCHHGYDATGICIALGNYHNMDRTKKRIAPEYIHLDDFDNLARWFVALCRTGGSLRASDAVSGRRLDRLETKYAHLLRRTTDGAGL